MRTTFDVSPLVVQTAQIAGGISTDEFDRPVIAAWAWGLIEKGVVATNLSVLANEAKVLDPSELGAEIRLAFDVLNLGLPSDRYDGNALFLYGHLALAWHDDRELEQTILREARGNFETQPLYDLAHVLSDLEEFGYPHFHKDPDMNPDNRTVIVRRRCTEWLGRQSQMFYACISSYMTLENRMINA